MEDTAPSPPHDIAAERYTLSAMMDHPAGVAAAAEVLAPDDFWRPAHQVIFRALVMMTAADEPVNVISLREWILRDGDGASVGSARAGEYIAELKGLFASWREVLSFAGPVRDRAIRRRLLLAASRMTARVHTDADLADIAASCQDDIDKAVAFIAETDQPGAGILDAAAFASAPSAKPEPVIPGLLNRGDRVMVVAAEGSGKTTIAAQVVTAAAAGRHPFWSSITFPPLRALMVDLENPRYLLQEALDRSLRAARLYGCFDDTRLQILSRPSGLDLARPSDTHLLSSLIRKAAPDIICAGPVYKMFSDKGERSDHDVVAAFWDVIRERHNCAIWLEHHAPMGMFGKRPMRPGGSGLWSRWPEIGLALQPGKREGELKVGRFRYDRGSGRVWPDTLYRSVGGGWPWGANYPSDTFLEAT